MRIEIKKAIGKLGLELSINDEVVTETTKRELIEKLTKLIEDWF